MRKIGLFIPHDKTIQNVIYSCRPSNCELIPNDGDRFIKYHDIKYLIVFARQVDKKVIDQYPNLQFIQMLSAGVDGIDLEHTKENKILVVDNDGTNSTSVAEHTIMFILSLLRNQISLQRQLLNKTWQQPPPLITQLHELNDKTVGIIGYGRIGEKVAQRLFNFNTKLLVNDIRSIDSSELSKVGAQQVSLDKLFAQSDVITFHVPLTSKTFHLINNQVLTKLKRGVYIINTSRGGVADIRVLLKGLEQGIIVGVGLDVFEIEPFMEAERFEKYNAVLSPHRAGSSNENWHSRVKFAFKNIHSFAEGRKLKGRIYGDFDK